MNRRLGILVVLLIMLQSGAIRAAPQWVAHASAPGPDLAEAGRSRFDQLFAGDDGTYRIPFPFEELVAQLESKIDNSDASGVRRVFIPLGRSLQRNAAAPDFFRHPRAVIALQGEPGEGGDVLRYRLFIAHQPVSETLEIISYNDSAGRFEFQVVDNYAAGKQAVVRQANRRMCMSCHQNAAPIFPARPWSETTFNVEVASRLIDALPDRFQSLVGTLTDDAGAIDLLVERANYLAAAQLIWQRGCGTARCRAAALRAALQYRLSGESGFARDTRYRDDYYAELERNWRRVWPDGLALGNSRIADREPFAEPTRALDPLTPRPAHAIWRSVDAVVADGIIYRLAGFVTLDDIRRLDAYLAAAGESRGGPVQRLRADCRLANVAAGTKLLECSDGADKLGLHALLELEYEGASLQSLHVLSLRMPGDPSLLRPGVKELIWLDGGRQAELFNPDGGLSMRLANGDRLQSLRLSWAGASLREGSRLEVLVVREFEFIDHALTVMLQNQHRKKGDSLAGKPFRRAAVITELDEALATPPAAGPWGGALPGAGLSARPAPPGNVVAGRSASSAAVGQSIAGLELLWPLCGNCHGSERRNPPGFLAGSDRRGRVEQCAPRILARLKAWRDDSGSAIAPMPPPATIESDWAEGEHYRELVAAVEDLLRAARKPPDGISAEAADNGRLPPCLAPG